MYNKYIYPQERYGFVVPFVLGGITGGILAPYFNNNYNYNNIPYQNKINYNGNYPYYNYYYSGYRKK